MKAAIVEKPGVLKVRELPNPVIGEYDVLCKILYGATCTGTDQHIIHGRFPFFSIPYPTILGHESIGRVIETGPKVRYFEIGDLVTRVGAPPSLDGKVASHWGGYAEMGIARDHWTMCKDGVNPSEWNSFRVNQLIPSGIDPIEATMIITWRETLSYIKRMGVNGGCSVLIMGSGGNGLSFANHAVNLGASKVIMTGNINRKDVAQAIGVSKFFNYKSENLIGMVRECNPDGFDFIIDAVGKAGLMDKMMNLLKDNGTIGIYGIDDLNNININPLKSGKTFTFYNGGYDEEETHDLVISYIKKGMLRAEYWLGNAQPIQLDDINQAFESIAEKKVVKALIQLSQE